MSLTDLTIKNLPIPEKGQTTFFDKTLAGFGVRVSMGGTKTFILVTGKERRRLTIGRYPTISLAQAREVAKKRLAERTLGADHTPISLEKLKIAFLEAIEPEVRERTFADYKWLLGRLKLSGDANRITPRQLTEHLDKLAPSTRSHTIAVYKMLFRFAKRQGYMRHNPIEEFVVRQSKPRERTLSEAEIKTLWHHLTGTFGTICKLALITGQRRGEIQHIEIQGEAGYIPPEITKNKRPHLFPIGSMAKGLLAEDLSYNGWSKGKAALDKKVQLEPWTLHDLRRTFATLHAQLGTPPHLIERLLNHVTGSMTPLARTYNQHAYFEELKPYVLAYEKHLATLVAPGE